MAKLHVAEQPRDGLRHDVRGGVPDDFQPVRLLAPDQLELRAGGEPGVQVDELPVDLGGDDVAPEGLEAPQRLGDGAPRGHLTSGAVSERDAQVGHVGLLSPPGDTGARRAVEPRSMDEAPDATKGSSPWAGLATTG
jgi:hypothetical protein